MKKKFLTSIIVLSMILVSILAIAACEGGGWLERYLVFETDPVGRIGIEFEDEDIHIEEAEDCGYRLSTNLRYNLTYETRRTNAVHG